MTMFSGPAALSLYSERISLWNMFMAQGTKTKTCSGLASHPTEVAIQSPRATNTGITSKWASIEALHSNIE